MIRFLVRVGNLVRLEGSLRDKSFSTHAAHMLSLLTVKQHVCFQAVLVGKPFVAHAADEPLHVAVHRDHVTFKVRGGQVAFIATRHCAFIRSIAVVSHFM